MTTEQQTVDNGRSFMVPGDIFRQPNLDIYAQMVYIVMRSYAGEAGVPNLQDIAQNGRMNARQATRALQSLVELKIVPHKLFRQIVGEFADDRLSWAAKGLLAYFNENPQIKMSEMLELSSQSGDDEQHIRKALKELHRHGYLEEYPELKRMAN